MIYFLVCAYAGKLIPLDDPPNKVCIKAHKKLIRILRESWGTRLRMRDESGRSVAGSDVRIESGQASVPRDAFSPTPPGPEGSNGNGLLRVQWVSGAWLY
jgi:hypothetical protein